MSDWGDASAPLSTVAYRRPHQYSTPVYAHTVIQISSINSSVGLSTSRQPTTVSQRVSVKQCLCEVLRNLNRVHRIVVLQMMGNAVKPKVVV